MRDAQQQLDFSRETLSRQVLHKIQNCRQTLVHMTASLQARSPMREISVRRSRFTDLHRRFAVLPARLVENAKIRFHHIEGILRVLGPDATLRRGYSITTNERGKLIRSVATVRSKMKIRTRVSDGEFESQTH
jgi:exodeoxyribonuclease VII large subunit